MKKKYTISQSAHQIMMYRTAVRLPKDLIRYIIIIIKIKKTNLFILYCAFEFSVNVYK